MRYGFWLPVFGGWLRNLDDEQMETSWEYASSLARSAEQWGYDLTLIAELNLNDIKGIEAPSLDAWSTAAALAAVTERLELMVAVRPTFHNPALLAKQAASIDRIAKGRLSLNVVSSWWKDEATKYGIPFDEHDDRYARTSEWLDVIDGCWREQHFTHKGKLYDVQDNVLSPKPAEQRNFPGTPAAPQPRNGRPTLYAGGESETAKNLIAAKCDAYLMHGDPPEIVGKKVTDMKRRREALGLGPMTFGVSGYAIVRDSDAEAAAEVDRITDVQASARSYASYQQWITGSKLEQNVSLRDYSVSNRGLRSGFIGTPERVKERLEEFAEVGIDVVLLQSSPQAEEMERFAAQVIGSPADQQDARSPIAAGCTV
jgi:FMNH2-dependent dimethyl sulfone monooxygenase